MAMAVGFWNDFVGGDVDEDATGEGQHDGQGRRRRPGKQASEQGTKRDPQSARHDHKQSAPRWYARLAQWRAHDHAFADVLDADRDDQQPTEARAVAGGEASANGE